MNDTLNRVFTPYTLLIINGAIIVLALTTGGGSYFITTGLIHLIALIFIALSILRILYHSYTYDPILQKFVNASLFAMFIFAGSHVTEYVSMMFFNQYQDSLFANVANFYLIGTFSIIAGATYFTSINNKSYAYFLRKVSFVIIMGLLLFSVYLYTHTESISLEVESATPYLYAGMIIIASTLAVIEINKIKHLTSIMRSFTMYLLGALIVLLFAILPYIFYDALAIVGIPEYGSLYVAHFLFYAALSLFLLSFNRLTPLDGVYEDLRKTNMP